MCIPKTLLLSLCFFISTTTFSQKLFLHPYVGGGIAGVSSTGYLGKLDGKPDMATTAGVQLGYKISKLRLSIGATWLTTGEKLNQPVVFTSLTYPMGYDSAHVTYTYKHILIPIKVGFEFRLGKLSVIPSLGIAPAYNLGEYRHLKSITTGKKDVLTLGSTFDNQLKRFSLFGLASVQLAYNINKHIAITLSPTYTYMFTNILKKPAGAPFKPTQRHYALTGNIGLLLTL